jgi:hypothetical protein
MQYSRPQLKSKLAKQEKTALLNAYFEHYKREAAEDPRILNVKIPREALSDLLDQIGALLIDQSRRLAGNPGPVRRFLDENPLPESIACYLPDDFRVFCLVLNALKQWVSAEQLATDRFLFGGTARQVIREAASTCLVTGIRLDADNTELHHPVRDGRPPVPLSKEGHARLENQSSASDADPVRAALVGLKKEGSRSWVMLRRGCLDLLGRTANHSTPKVGASSRTFARKAARRTGLSYKEILEWLDQNDL